MSRSCLIGFALFHAGCSEAAQPRKEQTLAPLVSASAPEASALPTTSAARPIPTAPASAAIDATFSQFVATITQADAAVPLLRVAAVKASFAPGQAVRWNGLVGATIDSNGHDIAVLPVWDHRSKVTVVVEGTEARGIVTGTGSGNCAASTSSAGEKTFASATAWSPRIRRGKSRTTCWSAP